MNIKNRSFVAFILSFILLFQGICSVDTEAYSSFAFLKLQEWESGKEAIGQASSPSSYGKICTTGMIFGNRDGLVFFNKSLAGSYSRESSVMFFPNKIPANQFFYYTIVSVVFSQLFYGAREVLRYIHNQDGEK